MKTLLLMRHAKSSWDDPSQLDHDRPLNERGERDVPRMARRFRSADVAPDLIVCSSAVRAQRTAEALHDLLQTPAALVIRPELYHAPPAAWFSAVQQLPDETTCVLMVGHNPGLEEFLHRLTGHVQRMPTAAVARLALDVDRWADCTQHADADLVAVWRPKELDG